MNNWINETEIYLPRLNSAVESIYKELQVPINIPNSPLEIKPTYIQNIIQRAFTFLQIGALERSREIVSAINYLWKEGFFSTVGTLTRLLFELWSVTYYLRISLEHYKVNMEMDQLGKIVDKIFEGVRSEVLLPWGATAHETPIHILDAIRALNAENPNVIETYNDLCESNHPNLPRYLEWWFIGRRGNNWRNQTVQSRGHSLLLKTVEIIETSVIGVTHETERGYELCQELYK